MDNTLNLRKRIEVSPDALQEKLIDHFGYIPDGFLDHLPRGKFLVYLSSCVDHRLVFMEPTPERFTGYTLKEIIAGGIDLQISRIHPDDLQKVYDKILRMLNKNTTAVQRGGEPTPFVLEYRMQRADGQWIDIEETRVYQFFDDGTGDRLLAKMVDISERKAGERSAAQNFAADPENEYPFLRSLRKFKKGMEKQPIHPTAERSSSAPEGIGSLTKREKEILQLVGSGLSTKQIAARLFISINTVQTHRTHLLQKLQVKNSMELIREASKAFWL